MSEIKISFLAKIEKTKTFFHNYYITFRSLTTLRK
jgi:hypothetical protein